MGESKNKRRKTVKKATERSLTELADAAFEQAARKVIERARQTGTPVIVWENGAVKELDPWKLTLSTSRRKKSPRSD